MLKFINLQLFAGEEFTPDAGGVSASESLVETDETLGDEDAGTDESAEQSDDTEDAEAEGTEEQEEAKAKEPDDSTPWVKKRLARAERAFERKMLDEINAESDGHEIPRRDLSKAVKLWNTLRVNPELSAKVNQLVASEITAGHAKTLDRVQPTGGVDVREQRLALREARLEYRETDPVYRKYEQDILDWAEDEGLRIRTERDLKSAIREWKGVHARQLATKAEAKKAPTQKAKPSVVPPTGKQNSARAQQPIDYRKASVSDILKREGMSFFSPD